jgi:hypothetical protein
VVVASRAGTEVDFRKVYEHGKVVRKDSFTSHYVAVGDTMIYGPGGHPPRIDFVLPSI